MNPSISTKKYNVWLLLTGVLVSLVATLLKISIPQLPAVGALAIDALFVLSAVLTLTGLVRLVTAYYKS